MKNNSLLGISLALLIGVGAISGCSPQNTNPASPTTNSSAKPADSSNGTTTTVGVGVGINTGVTASPSPAASSSTGSSTTVNSGTSASAQATSVTNAKDAMTAYNDDEATFSDSESVSADSFKTKAMDEIHALTSGNPTLTAGTSATTTTTATNTTTGVATTTTNPSRGRVRKDLISSGAVVLNADGTVTVDPVKFAAEKDKLRSKLSAVRVILKDKLQTLRRKNNVVRTSDVETKDNGDGTTTKTTNIEFKNDKANITRENVFSVTTNTADGKVVGREHSLKITHNLYSRTSTRIVTIDATTGAKKVVTDSTTTWKDGRKRVAHEERNLDATGAGTGTGTITITSKDGKVTTYNLSSKITADVAVSATTTDPASNSAVSSTVAVDGSATQTVTTDGKAQAPETTTLETSDTASSSATVVASPAPAATMSPAPATT